MKLFNTPRTSWEDYPKDAMSKGGGIYPRGAKSIKLSPEARATLGEIADVMRKVFGEHQDVSPSLSGAHRS